MPELPEVEVVKRSLKRKVLNLTIKSVKINDMNLRYTLNEEDFNKIRGRKIKKSKEGQNF